jgi:arylsulfatase A-like enzyme
MTSPNILLITIDAWRADHCGPLGGDQRLTPNINAFARRGTVYARAFTNGGWTMAAMTALLSSTYASMYHALAEPFASERPSLPEILRAHGYLTAGLSTNPVCGREPGFGRGFDYFRELRPTLPPSDVLRSYAESNPKAQVRAHAKARREGRYAESKPFCFFAGAEELVDAALAWLPKQSSRPWFMWLHFMDLHWPLAGSRRSWTLVDHAHAWRLFGATQSWVREKCRAPDPLMLARYRAAYADEVRTVDEQVGRLLVGVHAIDSDARVVLTGDHGESFFEHGTLFHSEGLHDQVLHVPLLIDFGGERPAGSVNDLVQHLDIAPTVLCMAAIDAPSAMLGLPLQTSAGQPSRPIISERFGEPSRLAGNPLVSIRTDTHKYVYDLTARRKHVYDLVADPGETQDIAASLPPEQMRAFDAIRLKHVSSGLIKMMAPRNGAKAPQPAWHDGFSQETLARLVALGYLSSPPAGASQPGTGNVHE